MTVKAVKAACVKVALPEAFSLPRKFGVSWGCFTQGAFYGVDAVVAEGGVKGLYFRYVLPYDAIAKRYLAVYKRREEREATDCRSILQTRFTSWRRNTKLSWRKTLFM
jgi:hypothetical protein